MRICLSGGFCRRVIWVSSVVVQSGEGVCVNSWLHVSWVGQGVMISAYSILGGG